MTTKVHPHNYWNKERCKKELSKYTRKLEAKYKSPSAYNSAYNHGWLDEIAPHLQSKTYWNKEKCFEEVEQVCLQYHTSTELKKANLHIYNYVMRMHWQDKCFSHMESSHKYRRPYTWEEILDKIKLCSRLKKFTENYPDEYHAALRQTEWKRKLYKMLPSNKKSSNNQ